MTLTLYDEFAGWGGSSQGCTAVPGVELILAANHNKIAIDVHSLNFPDADHYMGDIAKADIGTFSRADLFWASPSCPPWSNARGVRRDFDRSTQGVLFDEELGPVATNPAVVRARALMEEVPRYLRAMVLRGRPVLAGVVENVIECRKWDQWRRWLREIQAEGYQTRVIALNSMHAIPRRTRRAPQSRDRLYVGYWLASLGREPDWDKWLRPKAYCPRCDVVVDALQVFKQSGVDMGRYGRHGQYYYRCPHRSCRHQVVQPGVLPAVTAIDWSLPPGQRIGERVDAHGRPDPLKPATLARIEAGLARYAMPLLSPAGGTWREDATPLTVPMPARTTRDCDGLVVPPLLVPLSSRENKNASPATAPLRTQTCRQETGLVLTLFIATLRGGGSTRTTRGIDEPLTTFSANGTHHGLVISPEAAGLRWDQLLVPYYSTGTARPISEPIGTLTTTDRYALAGVAEVPRVDDCTFRMLAPHEIAAGMAFAPDYKVKGTNRQKVRGYGNAVTPPVAEILVSALVEAITGEDIERYALAA